MIDAMIARSSSEPASFSMREATVRSSCTVRPRSSASETSCFVSLLFRFRKKRLIATEADSFW